MARKRLREGGEGSGGPCDRDRSRSPPPGPPGLVAANDIVVPGSVWQVISAAVTPAGAQVWWLQGAAPYGSTRVEVILLDVQAVDEVQGHRGPPGGASAATGSVVAAPELDRSLHTIPEEEG